MWDHCFCFAEGKYLAWCDVALWGQLRDLGRCHFRLRLHSHMTSAVEEGTAQVDIMVWKSSMSLLCSSKVMCGLLSVRYVIDRWSFLTVTVENLSVQPL